MSNTKISNMADGANYLDGNSLLIAVANNTSFQVTVNQFWAAMAPNPFPNQIEIDAFWPWDSNSYLGGVEVLSPMNGYMINPGGNNSGPYLSWPVNLSAGNWQVTVGGALNPFGGIISVRLNDIEKDQIDFYSANRLDGAQLVSNNISVPVANRYDLKLKIVGKNANSANYYCPIYAVRLTKIS